MNAEIYSDMQLSNNMVFGCIRVCLNTEFNHFDFRPILIWNMMNDQNRDGAVWDGAVWVIQSHAAFGKRLVTIVDECVLSHL